MSLDSKLVEVFNKIFYYVRVGDKYDINKRTTTNSS